MLRLTTGRFVRSRAASSGVASVQILLVIVMVLGLFFAIFLGQTVANENFRLIGLMVGLAVAVIVGLSMRQKVWLLIPLCWLLVGKISILPLPFSVRDMGVLMAFGMFLFFYAFKMVQPSRATNRYDIILWINLVYLGSVYLRNPVGTAAFGSEMIGGRPYIDILIALMAYWVLQRVTITPQEGYRLPILLSLGSAVVSGLGVLTIKFPQLVPFIFPFYSGIEVGAYLKDASEESTDDYRLTPLSSWGSVMGRAAVAYFSPQDLMLFLRPLWSIVYYSAIICCLISGFRSGFVYFAIFSAASSYFRRGFAEVFRIGVAIVFGVILIMFAQGNGVPVHSGIQRALSFIPGPWDPEIVGAAQSSTDWRFEMWEIALTSDKYIKHKILGDGFGYKLSELALQQSTMAHQGGFIGENAAEAFMVAGAFHSGPVSSIRFVGLIGLILFTVFLIACAFYAWKLILRARGTPFFPLALFIGTPAIYKPIEFWFVFGGLDSDYPMAIFALGMLNLTAGALEVYEKNKKMDAVAPQGGVENAEASSSQAPLYRGA